MNRLKVVSKKNNPTLKSDRQLLNFSGSDMVKVRYNSYYDSLVHNLIQHL